LREALERARKLPTAEDFIDDPVVVIDDVEIAPARPADDWKPGAMQRFRRWREQRGSDDRSVLTLIDWRDVSPDLMARLNAASVAVAAAKAELETTQAESASLERDLERTATALTTLRADLARAEHDSLTAEDEYRSVILRLRVAYHRASVAVNKGYNLSGLTART
jgi:hypothetical protein